MTTTGNDEVLAFGRFQRAVNHMAVAKLEVEQAYLTGRDADVDAARAKLLQATDTLARACARAVVARSAQLRAQQAPTAPPRPGALEYEGDDDYDQERFEADEAGGPAAAEDVPPPGPPIQHRVLQGSTSDIALCGAAMSASTVNAPACPDCNAVLEARLGTVTHRSPSFRA